MHSRPRLHALLTTALLTGVAAGLAPAATVAQAAPPAPPAAHSDGPAGLWQGVILYDPGRTEIDIMVELAQAPDGHWAGTIDVVPMKLQFQPLTDISVDGREVTFWFNRDSPTAGRVESPFRGTVSQDGTTLSGEFVEGGKNPHRFELERIGEAGDPRPEPETAEIHPLSAEPEELRDAFNRHPEAVRVVMLLSPT